MTYFNIENKNYSPITKSNCIHIDQTKKNIPKLVQCTIPAPEGIELCVYVYDDRHLVTKNIDQYHVRYEKKKIRSEFKAHT